jgi:hypothetical protein
VRLREPEWDEKNEAHIAEHGVVPLEVEELLFEDEPHYRRAGKGVHHVYGRTGAGRYLFVVLRILGRGRGRVVTARNMTRKERRF